jgi:hypothetical protein
MRQSLERSSHPAISQSDVSGPSSVRRTRHRPNAAAFGFRFVAGERPAGFALGSKACHLKRPSLKLDITANGRRK